VAVHGFLPRAVQRISDQTPLAPSPAAETVEVQDVLAKARFAAGLATMASISLRLEVRVTGIPQRFEVCQQVQNLVFCEGVEQSGGHGGSF